MCLFPFDPTLLYYSVASLRDWLYLKDKLCMSFTFHQRSYIVVWPPWGLDCTWKTNYMCAFYLSPALLYCSVAFFLRACLYLKDKLCLSLTFRPALLCYSVASLRAWLYLKDKLCMCLLLLCWSVASLRACLYLKNKLCMCLLPFDPRAYIVVWPFFLRVCLYLKDRLFFFLCCPR